MRTVLEHQHLFPLGERLGPDSLYVERDTDIHNFEQWLAWIPRGLAQSRALVARAGSGKSTFLQRLFNRLWQQRTDCVPFYYEIPAASIWLPNLAEHYFRVFASHYLAFRLMKPDRVTQLYDFKDIARIAEAQQLHAIAEDVHQLQVFFSGGRNDQAAELAFSAPHRYAQIFKTPVVVLLDEFQRLGTVVTSDALKQVREPSAVSFFEPWLASKSAPALLALSRRGRQAAMIDPLVRAGAVTLYDWDPCLSFEEGLEAVFRYAQDYNVGLTNESALLLNSITQGDAWTIAQVVRRAGRAALDLDSSAAVKQAVTRVMSERDEVLALSWMLAFESSALDLDDPLMRRLLFVFTDRAGKDWSVAQLLEHLELDETQETALQTRLDMLHNAGLILTTTRHRVYQGHRDPTLQLVLHQRFAPEGGAARVLEPVYRHRLKSLRKHYPTLESLLHKVSPRFAALQLGYDMRERAEFTLDTYFDHLDDASVFRVGRVFWQYVAEKRIGDKCRFDLKITDQKGRVLLVDVICGERWVDVDTVHDFLSRIRFFREAEGTAETFAGLLALEGFSPNALKLCAENQIGVTTQLRYLRTTWSEEALN
ncbi:hypothetical protein [Acanthopleuribacter pedis]|uniref:ATP-binding protein n=1 Tax=Acanthopleuribacter pedis TaxID=442870 RepID=A0A8J7U6S0_9BACT|nr:hypothetical protein [Acanthopleuribacter pedis]MBO1323057.1 hypothetical protein [Acanthopleuribacter pedis]